MYPIWMCLISTTFSVEVTDKWRIHQDKMEAGGYCEIVGNNDNIPHLTYSVEIYANPGRISVVVIASTLDHSPLGRFSFNIPGSQPRSCQKYLLAAENTLKTLNMTLMGIPRIHIGGITPIRVRGPGGFDVSEYTISNSTKIWQTSAWVQLHCPYDNAYTIFNPGPPSPGIHPRGVCGGVAFVREKFRDNCS